ncbi:MAG: glycosyltransferase [Gemmatimonadetes bacterium]|nr:glycosyltransferase family 4 protein [Gemmatimonadota bacterium]NNF13898.1 glycosyltransferase [Gemmatimonadota bacterium]
MKNHVLSAYVRHQAGLVRRVEAEYCPRFDLNLTMSELDSKRILDVAPSARVREAPNAVDLETFPLPDPESERSNSVTFVGPTYLFANGDAVEHLLSDIWPRVRRLNPDATLTLIGRNAPGEQGSFAAVPGVEPLGRVEDVRPHLGTTGCSVIPIRVGGGTRIKILESWALGRAVVTTTLGCEGLDVTDGVNALVRDDPKQFAAAVAGVLDDADLRGRLGREGRATVEAKYSWTQVGASVRQRYSDLIESRAAS